MDEEEDGDEDSKGKGDKDDKGVGKVEALTNGVKSMKLENGGTAASKVEVDKDDEDSGGSDDESRYVFVFQIDSGFVAVV